MIGILDSGVGGLSVWREVKALLPGEDLVYVGDSAYCPYGAKSREELQRRVGMIVDFLLERGAEVIVFACNSATIQVIECCRKAWAMVPFVGMEPGVKPAVAMTRSGVIGVLATEASLTGEMFGRLVAKHGEGCRILTQACPRFVELVEAGELQGAGVDEAIGESVEPLLAKGADVLVLGCTHYPFLKTEIARLYPDVVLIDTGAAVARRVRDVLLEKRPERAGVSDVREFYTSADPQELRRVLSRLLPELSDVNVTITRLPERKISVSWRS